MSLFSAAFGFVRSFIQFGGPTGPALKIDSGNFDARNSGDSAFVNVRGADPSIADDLVTKRYGDANYSGGGGSSANTGTALVDFGAYPGKSDATVSVTGQTHILTTSTVQAWLYPSQATTDHSIDEHRIEEIEVYADADSLVAGTGFTIFARTRNDLLYGKWYVAWLWF